MKSVSRGYDLEVFAHGEPRWFDGASVQEAAEEAYKVMKPINDIVQRLVEKTETSKVDKAMKDPLTEEQKKLLEKGK